MKNLAARVIRFPQGLPTAEDFEFVELAVAEPGPGEVLFQAEYMSINPAIRRYLPAPPGTPGPLGGTAQVGDLAINGARPPAPGHAGGFVGRVLDSRHPDFTEGDLVRGGHRWQTHHVVPGTSLSKVAPGVTPLDSLGLVGQPAFVAWCGLRKIGRPKPGETMVVSAAGGAVGMVAGQLGKAAGARVIGIASGEKAHYVVDELGFDACLDRLTDDVPAGLDDLCPEGVDVYFDNVGGTTGRAVFDRMRDFGRYVVCGMASEYNAPEGDVGPPLRPVLRKRLRIEGFVVYDHYDEFDDFTTEINELVQQQRLRYRYDVHDGLPNAPQALANLLQGQNRGKVVVRL